MKNQVLQGFIRVLVIFGLMALTACGDEQTIQTEIPVKEASYKIEGSLDSNETFGKEDAGSINCSIGVDDNKIKIWNQELHFNDENRELEGKRIIQIVDTSDAFQTGGIGEVKNDDLLFPAVIFVKEKNEFTLRNADSCFVVYDSTISDEKVVGSINCPKLTSPDDDSKTISFEGSFECTNDKSLSEMVGLYEIHYPKQ